MTKDDILSSLWVEKYRPKRLEDVALAPAYREKLSGYLRDGMIPHMLFEGPPGSGKTTVARILIDSLDCEALRLNASDERGIDVVRGKIKNFARVSSMKKFKVVFMDEADALTDDAQDALRATMEAFAAMTRFVLTCNYLTKITEPIQSRCQTGLFHFSAMPQEEMARILKTILSSEKIGYEDADVAKHIAMCYPDMRRAISLAQQAVRSGRFAFVDETEKRRAVLNLILARDLKSIRKLLSEGRAGDYSDLYRYVYDNVESFDQKVRLQVLLDAAEYMWRDSSVADKEMNFAAFCAKVMRSL